MKRLVIGRSASGYLGALFEGGRIVELFQEEALGIAGNIYLGKVKKILESLNGAFVDIGLSKAGYLKLSDITGKFRKEILQDGDLSEGKKILVQVKKDGVRSKGPQLTTKISLPGRFVVYFPLSYARGISRKISGEERERLKKVLKDLKAKDEGVVIRTGAMGVDEEFILEEYRELRKSWQEILTRFKRSRKPKILYGDNELHKLVIRDRLEKDLSEIITNDVRLYKQLKKASEVYKEVSVRLCEDNIFEKFGVYKAIDNLLKRKIYLESGGEIVIDVTEALTVIDVNTASNVKASTYRDLILKTNLEAAKEIARQIRLRNIGGMILVDFITMDNEEDKKLVIDLLKKETSKDRAKVDIYGFTKMGLLEIVRRRSSRSYHDVFFKSCPVCGGTGMVISPKLVLERIENELKNSTGFKRAEVNIHQSFSGYITSSYIKKLKKNTSVDVKFSFGNCDPSNYTIKYYKNKEERE